MEMTIQHKMIFQPSIEYVYMGVTNLMFTFGSVYIAKDGMVCDGEIVSISINIDNSNEAIIAYQSVIDGWLRPLKCFTEEELVALKLTGNRKSFEDFVI